MTEKEKTKATNKELAKIEKPSLRDIMMADKVKSRFTDVLGPMEANAYISSVLIVVSQSPALQECNANSIIGCALRSATMRLSVDPGMAQAYLVPFKNNATLIIGYKGYWNMALRTGQYKILNLATVYKNDELTEDPMTGQMTLKRYGLHLNLAKEQPRSKDEIAGYLLYFELKNGYSRSFYMSCQECELHGKEYSKSYPRPDSIWKTDPHAMYKKTVVRMGLTKWGYLDPMDILEVETEDQIGEPIAPEYMDGGVSVSNEPFDPLIESSAVESMSFEEKSKALGFGSFRKRPYSPEKLKEFIDMTAKKFDGDVVGDKKRNLLAGIIDLCFAHDGADMDRHELCQFLTGEPSTKKIADSYILALWEWIEPAENQDGIFAPDEMAVREAISALRYARKQSGQEELF